MVQVWSMSSSFGICRKAGPVDTGMLALTMQTIKHVQTAKTATVA